MPSESDEKKKFMQMNNNLTVKQKNKTSYFVLLWLAPVPESKRLNELFTLISMEFCSELGARKSK